MTAPVIGVGLDLVAVSEIRQSVNRFGTRYLEGVFTGQELEDCLGRQDPSPQLAARYAAKEAALKALRVEGTKPPWRQLGLIRRPQGGERSVGCVEEVELTGSAAELAGQNGVERLVASTSHQGDEAVAIVFALGVPGLLRAAQFSPTGSGITDIGVDTRNSQRAKLVSGELETDSKLAAGSQGHGRESPIWLRRLWQLGDP